MFAFFFLIVSVVLVVLAFFTFGRARKIEREGGYTDAEGTFMGGVVLSVVAFFLFLFAVVLPTGVSVPSQIEGNRQIDKTHAVEAINTRKASALIPQFKSFLAEQYPQYEQQVFHDISHPGDVSLFFARYPELHASQSLADLVNRIDKLNSDIYNQQIKRQSLIAEGRSMKANPWLVGALLEDVHK